MIFTETALKGAYLIDLEARHDERGFFARAYCINEFIEHGVEFDMMQMNLSCNNVKGTLRGLHYQTLPAPEAKLVRCLRGTIYDVIVDVRPESPSYLQHLGVELSDENRRALLVPEGFAHGYQTLSDGAEVLYQVSEFYTPSCERGLRYDDAVLGIRWPLPVTHISPKDATWELLKPSGAAL